MPVIPTVNVHDPYIVPEKSRADRSYGGRQSFHFPTLNMYHFPTQRCFANISNVQLPSSSVQILHNDGETPLVNVNIVIRSTRTRLRNFHSSHTSYEHKLGDILHWRIHADGERTRLHGHWYNDHLPSKRSASHAGKRM